MKDLMAPGEFVARMGERISGSQCLICAVEGARPVQRTFRDAEVGLLIHLLHAPILGLILSAVQTAETVGVTMPLCTSCLWRWRLGDIFEALLKPWALLGIPVMGGWLGDQYFPAEVGLTMGALVGAGVVVALFVVLFVWSERTQVTLLGTSGLLLRLVHPRPQVLHGKFPHLLYPRTDQVADPSGRDSYFPPATSTN